MHGSTIFFQLGCPESQVVPNELHDGGCVLVLVFINLVNVSNGVIESFLGELTGLLWISSHFIVKDGVVKSESKSDGVSCLEITDCCFSCLLIGIMSSITSVFVLITGGVF